MQQSRPEQLRALPKPVRLRIGYRIMQLQDHLSGDVKKLAAHETLQRLTEEVEHLRERVEDLEDLRDLKQAIQRNDNKPLIPLAKVKTDVDID